MGRNGNFRKFWNCLKWASKNYNEDLDHSEQARLVRVSELYLRQLRLTLQQAHKELNEVKSNMNYLQDHQPKSRDYVEQQTEEEKKEIELVMVELREKFQRATRDNYQEILSYLTDKLSDIYQQLYVRIGEDTDLFGVAGSNGGDVLFSDVMNKIYKLSVELAKKRILLRKEQSLDTSF